MSVAATLRLVFRLEGISLLVLLLVAVPLKYAANLPEAVRVIGALHGLLFVILVLLLYRATIDGLLARRRALHTLALATIPFGFLFRATARHQTGPTVPRSP